MKKLICMVMMLMALQPVSAMEQEQPSQKSGLQKTTLKVMQKIKLNPALYKAAKAGDVLKVEHLLALGADPNASQKNDNRPLSPAADQGHLEICRLLLAAGADVNAQGKIGTSALMFAASGEHHNQGHIEVCRLLLAAGADVNARNKAGASALIFAANSGHEEICKLLINAGADLNLKGGVGKSALLWAATANKPQTCKLLLLHGADVFALSDHRELFSSWIYPGRYELKEVYREHLEYLVTNLIKQKADLNVLYAGKTLLHHAAWIGFETLSDNLIAAGADVNALDEYKRNSLALAERGYFYHSQALHDTNTRICTKLIDAGVLIDGFKSFIVRCHPPSIIPHIIIAPDPSNLAAHKKTILDVLLCFKNMHPRFPKDLQTLILAYSHTQAIGNLMIARRMQGKPILTTFKSATANTLWHTTITELQTQIARIYEETEDWAEPPVHVIDTSTFEPYFGEQIWENICVRLAQPKLLCNATVEIIQEPQSKEMQEHVLKQNKCMIQ